MGGDWGWGENWGKKGDYFGLIVGEEFSVYILENRSIDVRFGG